LWINEHTLYIVTLPSTLPYIIHDLIHYLMSNQITETKNVWKPGRSGDIEFANIRLLERQEPKTCEKIKWVEGFTISDSSYTYLVGLARWGLWLSRKLVSADKRIAIPSMVEIVSQNVEVKDSPLLVESTLNEFCRQIIQLKAENLMLRGKLLGK
jgi:hypothetical protein